MKKETLIAHAGKAPKEYMGVLNMPPHRASTILLETLEDFEKADVGAWPYPTYARYGNPSTLALESTISQLTGADNAVVYSSGLAAIVNVIIAYCGAGDHLLMVDTTYGCTRRFCDQQLSKLGIEVTYYDPLIGADIETLIKPNTKMVFCESPGSLSFEVQDIPAISEVARKHNALVVADCTWAGPLYFDALAKGVDIAMYSATKYMSGHSDVVAGILCCKEKHYKTLKHTAQNVGACASADDCYLIMRGLKTMKVRMEAQLKSAVQIANWLKTRDEVEQILYPVLEGDAGHELYKRDLTGGASMFGVLLKPCAHESLREMFNGLKYFGMGYSWGGFESLIITFDANRVRTATKWPHDGPNVRIHVGLEHPDDLIADLAEGLDKLRSE